MAGRLGIRAKILIYLAILAGFVISTVWMLHGVIYSRVYRGGRPGTEQRPAVIIRNLEEEQAENLRQSLEETLGAPADMTVLPLQDTLNRQLLLTIGAILLGTGLVGFTMARSISEPIIETNKAARELSRSRYTRPSYSGGYREIAELNDTLVRAAEDLSRVEDLQRELIANISHDLRTPLTMIGGYAEAMRDIPEEMTPENMQIIIDEAGRLNTMVNEVLEFSSLRAGNLKLEMAPFNLTALIRGICSRVSKMSSVDGYTVLFDAEEDLTVLGDSGRISQVVYNLLGNALTYTGADRTVQVAQKRTGAMVQVSISDSGEGIAPEELPYIWDRYYRSRENHRRAVIGSGLGLNICRGILEKHDAPFGVKSEPGQGTTFWFRLPAAEQDAAADDAAGNPEKPHGTDG